MYSGHSQPLAGTLGRSGRKAIAQHPVVVIGAGIGGLSSAVALAAAGEAVLLLERQEAPGGKMREVAVAGHAIDSGPTVLTMRWVFDELFAAAGSDFERAVTLVPAEILARHAWDAAARLDLFADEARSAEAIAAFAGPEEGRRFRMFCAEAARIYRTLEKPFLRASRPSPVGLAGRLGLGGVGALFAVKPFATLWTALGHHFRDPRLQQLFGRYATYCGSSPFEAPATLMLVAHVEQAGVWLVEGGMQRLAEALAETARSLGAEIRFGAQATEILADGTGVTGVRLAGGELIEADAVVFNGDAAALQAGLVGAAARSALRRGGGVASQSAVTWSMLAEATDFPLVRHNVFFGGDYREEFEAVFHRGRLPAEPTVYVCAQDRPAGEAPPPSGAERLLLLINAPAGGPGLNEEEIAACETRARSLLTRCGLNLRTRAAERTGPQDFAALFPGSGGALYGPASHGWQATFQRPGAETRLPGLYLAGGSVHPGPGVPMAALSGLQAAATVLQARPSTNRFRRAATSGGI